MVDPLEMLELESLRRLAGKLQSLVRSRLWLEVLLAMVAGCLLGLGLGPDLGLVSTGVATVVAQWLALPGTLFLALVQMIVVPLVFASVIRGLTASESVEKLRRSGLLAVLFFGTATALATALGIGIARIVRPGQYIAERPPVGEMEADAGGTPAELPSLADLPDRLIGVLPTNPLESMVSAQMLQVIVFAVILGVALLSLPRERSQPLYDVLGSLQDACMSVVKWAMRLAPLAVFGLMARLTSSVGLDTLAGMGIYVLTVLAGLLLLGVLNLIAVLVLGRRAPMQFLRSTREVLLLAFSTSSSAAVMPLSIKTAEDQLGVRPSTSQFVIPLGATINMTGTALYQGAATVFLADVFGVELAASGFLLVVVTAVAASIGSPATPGVGMVILAMVLGSVGIPASGIVLVMGVDRILDMSRTALNVMGDLVACVVLDRWTASDP